MENLKKEYKQTYLQNRNRVTDLENKAMVCVGINQATELGLDTLLHI